MIDHFLFQLIRVQGSSMEHTLRSGDVLLVVKPGKYRRGQVVICRYPKRVKRGLSIGASLSLEMHTLFVKRLVALQGDTVEILEGQLWVNGELAPDPAAMASPPRDMEKRTLRRNEYFVMGDNRRFSHDSRAKNVGPISASMLRGHAVWVLFPPSHAGRIR